ncbi:Arginine deiminase 2 [Candidatus Photodesmus katoptron]|uniref:arginine deiminase n=1 Tax=Candidatus Photodesmus anomalopis TaxID=28176 RepID=UPI0004D870E5|nr:arginine deiminase [Candidatus Photodesmus katoptron]KEY90539.1 Arginine deiminase 2 [Candidatus Photodesmus katoptron]
MSILYVGSEVGQLKRVLLNRPDRALVYLTPSNCNKLLFDDVFNIQKALKEYDIFVKTLLSVKGIKVFFLQNLLLETLEIDKAKEWLLNTQISNFRYGPVFSQNLRHYLKNMKNKELASILLGGLAYSELNIHSSSILPQINQSLDFVIEPLPNHMFIRDTSCWLYGGVSLNPMMKSSRKRETNHLRAIYRWHPMFSKQDFFTYFFDENINYDNVHIEGGDILVIGKGVVLVGISERTTPQGVESLAFNLFKNNQARELIAINLPKARSCMHLDTVMTHVNIDTFSIYPKVMHRDLDTWSFTPTLNGEVKIKKAENYIYAIEKALGLSSIQIITTGGDKYQAEREQWNDANNVLTVKPGLVISYEHNIYTNEKFDKAGIKVLTIPGNELGRGRGGTRCMSCPIERDSI